MLTDTHAHLNFNAFKNDADEVIRRSLSAGMIIINIGSQYETSERAVEIAERYPVGVYAAIGLHPIHLTGGIFKVKLDEEEIAFQTKDEHFDYKKYKDLALRSLGEGGKVVAIGEIGLDYYYKPKTKKKLEDFKNCQKEVFLKQLDLAKELNLPVIFHCRLAHDELINILNTKYKIQDTKIRGVIHCFTGTWEQAQKYLEMGFYLGFNGIIFKLDLDEIIKKTSLDKILIETDCPYLTPPQETGRNEPIFVKYVAEKIAELKNVNFEKVAEITTENAKKLFKI